MRMNGETFNLACLVRAARNGLATGIFDYNPEPYLGSLSFCFTERLGLFRMKKAYETTPADWYFRMMSYGLKGIFLLINTDDNGRHMQGFVNTKPIMALAVYKDNTLNFWQQKWEYSQQRKQWDITYTEHPWTTAPVHPSRYVDNRRARKSGQTVYVYVAQHGLPRR